MRNITKAENHTGKIPFLSHNLSDEASPITNVMIKDKADA
ncbi:hypothetical protein BIFAD42_14610 [Bifidobacterium adolescentis]|uniref:Uncharacterized protein n=1 Tax=Bifidobacterium adolescentis TaxID=1680 RepID=A0AAN5AGJ7_BIFAD|nr:hypothetical protein BIFAD42_14610 [Bifidobacterium adolescentis]